MNGTPRRHGLRQAFSAMRAPAVTKFAPLAGLACGALAGIAYWLAVLLWPSSVALILSMLIGALLTMDVRLAAATRGLETLSLLFYVLLKYNVLLALSAAKLPFDAPPNTALCLIMICGYGAARALLVCLAGSRAPPATASLSHLDLGVALLLGFSPALLLGVPGLIGLAAAVASIIGLSAAPRSVLKFAPWIAESCFYLGAQASWSYV
jgi:cobalamin synthase